VNGDRPASSTYVRPLERCDPAPTVLCVASDEALLSSLVSGLERADPDIRLLEARTLAQAFQVLDAENAGCVVSALSLADVDGVRFLRQIRTKYDHLPFVLVADRGSESVAADAINEGVDGYVPYEDELGDEAFETLVDRIETVVRDYRSSRRFEDATDLLFRLTEYTTDVLWMFTDDWEETVVINEAYEDVWDRRQADVIEDPADFLEGIYPDDRPGVLEKMEVISGGDPADLEYRIRTDDGVAWVSAHAEPVLSDGEVEHVAGFTREITERRESTKQLETLVENLPVIVFTFDADGVCTTSAGAGLEMLGLEPGELEGLSVYEAYAEHDDLTDAVDRALDGEELRVTLEVEGFVFETWYRPVFDEAGNVVEVVGVSHDVTRLKEREDLIERVNEATRELQNARTGAEVGRVVVEIVESVIGCPVTAYWRYDDENDRLEPTAASEPALDIGDDDDVSDLPHIEAGHAEMEVFRTGESRWVRDYADLTNPAHEAADLGRLLLVPLGDHGMVNIGHAEPGEFDDFDRYLVEILGQTATSALNRVERERALESRTAELERSNESLQQFAYVASHDLQEPLRMVSSYVSLLEAEYGDMFDEEAAEYMHYAVDGATRMQDMIDALLRYSRIRTEGDDFVEVDLEAVLDETRRSLELLVDEEEATVRAGDLPRVTADRSQVGQLLQNLVKNAVEHGGPEPTVEVDAVVEGDRVHLTVADDGPGVDGSQHERIFDIFKSNSDGTGIGLAVCERIAYRHDGDIWVESDPGAGATFHVTLPAVDADPDPGLDPQSAAVDGGHE